MDYLLLIAQGREGNGGVDEWCAARVPLAAASGPRREEASTQKAATAATGGVFCRVEVVQLGE